MDEARRRLFIVGLCLSFCYLLHYYLQEVEYSEEFFLCVAVMLVFVLFVYGVPILRALYHRHLAKIFDVAAAKTGEITKRVTDRLSEVGRRVSDRVVTEQKLSV